MSYIFISYSHKDKDYAHKLHQHLFEHGLDAWIDDRIDYGSRWPHQIEKRLKECSAFVLIMSPHSYESEWVQNELSLARELQKPIYPLLLNGDVWWHLRTTQYVNVTNGDLPPTRFFVSLTAMLKSQNKDTSHVSVHVGGNVEGNIVIGNHNHVQSSAATMPENFPADLKCLSCGAIIKPTDKACPYCGSTLKREEKVEHKKNEAAVKYDYRYSGSVKSGDQASLQQSNALVAQKALSKENGLPKSKSIKEKLQKGGWRLFNTAIILGGLFVLLLRGENRSSFVFFLSSISLLLYCALNILAVFYDYHWTSKPLWRVFVSLPMLGAISFPIMFASSSEWELFLMSLAMTSILIIVIYIEIKSYK